MSGYGDIVRLGKMDIDAAIQAAKDKMNAEPWDAEWPGLLRKLKCQKEEAPEIIGVPHRSAWEKTRGGYQ